MRISRSAMGQAAAVLGSAAAYGLLAYATPRPAFGQLVALFAGLFGLYAWLVHRPLPVRFGLLAALLLRLLWLPALPALSDDYHRFRWDGALVAAGQNPYQYRPDELVTAAEPAPSATAALYAELNSPHYYSVYPPVCQAAFGLGSWLFPDSAWGFVLVLRLLILTAEAATALLLLALLRHFGQPPQRAFLYLLNPLVIVELTGNLHFEALSIGFLLAAAWALTRGRKSRSAGLLALSAATKLLPLLLLPLLLRRLGPGAFLRYAALTTAGLGLLFGPFLSGELVRNLGRSLDLYFHKFEFNASLYYLARAVGYWRTGYNEIALIGTGLAGLAGAWVLVLAGRERQPTLRTLPLVALAALTGYYLLATTVHPWYLTPLVAVSVFTRFRFALVWSGLAVLSYGAYRSATYSENLPLVALEYAGVLAVLAAELWARPGRPAASA
jgi:alpha-1,6-mannosyltransferase